MRRLLREPLLHFLSVAPCSIRRLRRRQIERAHRLRSSGKSVREIAAVLDVSPTMAHRMLKVGASG